MYHLSKVTGALVIVCITVSGAYAQSGPVANQCSAEIKEYCASLSHYQGSVRACLESHRSEVSTSCRQALDTTGPGSGMGMQMLSPEKIEVLLKEQGYTDISKIERERRATYEVKARDAKGYRVELYVDGITGKVLRSERED